MNLSKFSPLIIVATISLLANQAQAFSIGGNSVYATDGLPNELSVDNEVQIPDGDAQFTVLDAAALQIGSLFLEGSLGEFGLTENSFYASVSSYITRFQFLGTEAVFNLNAGQGVLSGFIDDSNFTIDSMLSGDIVDLNGNLLGTAAGSLSSVQTGSLAGNFSINLEGTAINSEIIDPTPVPAPGLLLGVVSFAVGAFRKSKAS